jgi:hypothetical protein
MAAMFWQGVVELMERPEEEVATLSFGGTILL